MNSTFKVYLAGPITGLTFGESQDWRNYVKEKMDYRIHCYSPLRGKEYLATRGALIGAYDEYPLSTSTGITTRDRFDCTGSDLVIFNLLGAKTVSIGTMIELGWADAFRRPAIVVMEDSGNPHEHPMLNGTTHFRVNNLDDAIKLAEIILLNEKPLSVTELTEGSR